MDNEKSPLAWGLKYASLGIAISPFPYRGSGYKDATTDVDQITKWCEGGNVTGWQANLSRWTVVDLEDKNGKNGRATLDRLMVMADYDCEILQEIPCLRTKTGEGRHFWFYEPLKQRRIGLAEGIDVLENPMLPPMPGYSWEVEPGDGEAHRLPAFLHQMMNEAPKSQDGAGRNQESMSYAGGLVSQGKGYDDIRRAVLVHNAARDNPLSAHELERTVLKTAAKLCQKRDDEEDDAGPEAEVQVVFPMAEFIKMDFPEPDPLMGAIVEGSLNMFVGVTGIGKSFFSHSLHSHLGAGEGMFSGYWPCPGAQPSLIIDGESSPAELIKLAKAQLYGQRYDILPATHLMSSPSFTHGGWQELAFTLAEQYKLITFDNFMHLFDPPEGVSTTEAAFWIACKQFLIKLRGLTTVVLIDHAATAVPGKMTTAAGTKDKIKTMTMAGVMTPLKQSDNVLDMAGFELDFHRAKGGKTRGGYDRNLHEPGKVIFENGTFTRVL